MINEQIEALQSANEYLYKLKDGIGTLVDFINNNEVNNAYETIPAIAEGLDWIIKVVTLTQESQKEEIVTSDINEHLDSIVEALENEDYILVGDLFNYEILPILDRIHEQIKKIVE